MLNSKRLYIFCSLLCLFVVTFDQATKFTVLAFIPQGTVVSICPCVNLLLTFNFGTSFGLLSPSTPVQYYLLVALTICCLSFFVYVFCKLKSAFERIFCSILIGGALGNLLDRFLHGAVVDFVDVYYGTLHWPAFNFADTCITCSVIALLGYNLFSKRVH